MAEETALSQEKNHGWSVTFAGMGVNLALGILYSWSVISKNIPQEWGWNEDDKSMPYMFACLVFSLIMVPAGRMQDKIGPRIVSSIGGILVGIGFIIASQTTSLTGFVIGFGILAGAGLGFGYASATPPAVKWFPAAKTGLIAGIVVSGFGLASVYTAPLTKLLIDVFSFKTAILTLGIGFFLVVVILSQLLKTPPKGYVPKGSAPAKTTTQTTATVKKVDFLPRDIFGTIQFYMIWFMYACGAGAGLMVISKLAFIADKQAGIKLGFLMVAILAIGNGGGRILAGLLSDKIGRKATLFICFVMQAGMIFLLSKVRVGNVLANIPALAVISVLIGANYGANLSLFPSVTKDYFGLKNFGVNYGLVFTAWGIGGFVFPKLAGAMYLKHQTFDFAYYTASCVLILAAIMVFMLKEPHRTEDVKSN